MRGPQAPLRGVVLAPSTANATKSSKHVRFIQVLCTPSILWSPAGSPRIATWARGRVSQCHCTVQHPSRALHQQQSVPGALSRSISPKAGVYLPKHPSTPPRQMHPTGARMHYAPLFKLQQRARRGAVAGHGTQSRCLPVPPTNIWNLSCTELRSQLTSSKPAQISYQYVAASPYL